MSTIYPLHGSNRVLFTIRGQLLYMQHTVFTMHLR